MEASLRRQAKPVNIADRTVMPLSLAPNTKRRRAETEAETRRRITRATVDLHGNVGPAKTTISEIARLSGVQRLPVYSLFPDQRPLFEACATHWFGLHPPPDPADWSALAEPRGRIRQALTRLYDYYEANEAMIANWQREA
jgi:AcrR family transcriptional regulator